MTDEPFIAAAFLDPDERARLEELARASPEAQRRIAESERLFGAIERGRVLEARALDDLLLAMIAATSAGAPWTEGVLKRVEADPRAAARLEELRSRRAALEGGSDAGAHFRQLTGHSAGRRPKGGRTTWLAAASVVLLVLGHGLASRVGEDPVSRQLWLMDPPPGESRAPLQAATNDIDRARIMARQSRRTVLGLWPSYDAEKLAAATELLEGRQDPSALLVKARIEAMAGHHERALKTLEGLSGEGPRYAEADVIRALLAQSLR